MEQLKHSEGILREEQQELMGLAEEIYVISSWATTELEKRTRGKISKIRSQRRSEERLIYSIQEQLEEFLTHYRDFKSQCTARTTVYDTKDPGVPKFT